MAIDDNTSYELTGAQVKDLANKIKGKAADNTFVGATPAAPGSKGLVPEPQAGDGTKFLSGDGTWQTAPTVNNGALTIKQNGTTLDTFTANSPDDKTVNIQTITAETVTPAEEVGAITSSMIDWTTMFIPENITIDFGGNSRTAKRFKINATTYAIAFHGSTGVTTTSGKTRQITITYPQIKSIFCALVKYTVSGQTTPATGHSSFGATSADTYVSPVETSGSAINADLLIIAEMSA